MTFAPAPRRKPILVFDNALTLTALCANLLASLDEGLLSLSLSNILYIENPYSYKKFK